MPSHVRSSFMTRSRTVAVFATVAAVGGLSVALAAPASAHVTVSSSSAAQGGFSTITFKVPNESDTASTIKVSVAVPAATPLAFVSYQPIPGWTTKITKAKLATPIVLGDSSITEGVTSVTWTAGAGAGISAGQFQQFPLSVGPLPEADSITFPTTQTYSDGEVVTWADPAPADGSEADKPVPALMLSEAEEGSGHHAAPTASDTTSATSSSNGWAIGALVVALLALVVGVIAIVMSRGQRSE